MSSTGLKKGSFFAIILMVTLVIVGMGPAEASRRAINMNSAMEAGMIRNRKVEVSGKLFDVCINQTSKTITVKGYVDDWDEMDKVENYFKNTGPSDYQVICELDFAY